MLYADIKFDCKHFKGHIPCQPNKLFGSTCDLCPHYETYTHKILIIKLELIGDVLRTTPLLHRIRKKYPNAHISWLTNIPDLLPTRYIDCVYTLNSLSLMKIQALSFDEIINLDKNDVACILMSKLEGKRKFGFTWNNGHIDAVNVNSRHKLLTGIFDETSKATSKSYQEEIFEIYEESFNGEEYLIEKDHAIDEKWQWEIASVSEAKTVVGLNTGCGKQWRTRLWPTSRWLDLIKTLQKTGFFCILLGGQSEDAQNTFLAESTGAFYPGHFNLLNFAGLVGACDVVITSVTLALHIAIAKRREVILFNNIFNKNEFELYGRGRIVEPPNGCQCYYANTCEGEESCMKYISVDQVMESIYDLNPR